MKNFRYRFLQSYESCKVETCYSGLIYHVYKNQGQGPITLRVTSLDKFYSLPLMKNVCHTFLKNCNGYKVETRGELHKESAFM